MSVDEPAAVRLRRVVPAGAALQPHGGGGARALRDGARARGTARSRGVRFWRCSSGACSYRPPRTCSTSSTTSGAASTWPATVGIAGSIVGGRVRRAASSSGRCSATRSPSSCGIYLISVGGWPILVLGCLSALGGYLYSAGPRPIAYTPASEAAVFLFMGVLIVVIAYAVQAGGFPLYVPLAALPIGGPVAAILLANNLRDLSLGPQGRTADAADRLRPGGRRSSSTAPSCSKRTSRSGC